MKITKKDDGTLELAFRPSGDVLTAVRALPSRVFDAQSSTWRVAFTKENWRAMAARPDIFPLTGLIPPSSTGYSVDVQKGLLKIRTPWSALNAELLRRMPDYRMWDAKQQSWFAKPTRRNLLHLRNSFKPDQMIWSSEAEALYQEHVVKDAAQVQTYREQKAAVQAEVPLVDDYKFGGPKPFDWQRRCFMLSRDRKAFAIFAEQRTGKTKVTIDTVCWKYIHGKITQSLVIAPNSVKTNWITDELPLHM